MARMDIFKITFLLIRFTMIVSANVCQVQEKYSPDLWNGDPLKILAFISEQGSLTCVLNFQGLDKYSFHDKIVLTPRGNKVVRMDDEKREYPDIHSTLTATGWNVFTFSIDSHSTFMITVRNILVLSYAVKYPVKTITIHGSNISHCSCPSWAVEENEAIVIPLYTRPQENEGAKVLNPNNSSIYLTLSSTAPFNPIIKVDGIKRFLTMKNEEIFLSQNFSLPLRLKKYILEVHTLKQKVNINCKLDNVSKQLMEFQVTTVLSDIEISSQGMSFTVDLDLSSILITTTITTTTTTITTTTLSPLVVATNDGTSTGLVVRIVITVLAFLAFIVIIIIFYKRRQISRMKALSLGYHEETQQDDGNYRNSKSEMEIFIDDKNLVRLQEENRSDDGNCRRSANDLETLLDKGEGASDDRDQLKNTAKEYFEDTEDGTANNFFDMPVKKEHKSGSLMQHELLSPIILHSDHDVTMDHPSPRYTSSRPKSIHGTQTYVSQSANIPLSRREKSNLSQSTPALSYNSAPPLAVDRNTHHNTLSQNTNEIVDYDDSTISEEVFEEKNNQNKELCMTAIDKVNMYVTKGDNESAIETLINAIFYINKSEVAYDERSKDLIMILQDKLEYFNPEIENNINPDGVQPLLVPLSHIEIPCSANTNPASIPQLSISESAANIISSNLTLQSHNESRNVKSTREAYLSGNKSRKSKIKGASITEKANITSKQHIYYDRKRE